MSSVFPWIERGAAGRPDRRWGLPMLQFVVALTVACCAAAVPAHAARPAASPAAQEASRLSRKGVELFAGQQFAQAADLFLQAYRLDPAPDYLYSAARAEHAAGHLQQAHKLYALLLATTSPRNPFYAKAQASMARLTAELAQGQLPGPEVPLPPPSTPSAGPVLAAPVAPAPAPPATLPAAPTPTAAPAPAVAATLGAAPPAAADLTAAYICAGVGFSLLAAAAVSLVPASLDQRALDSQRSVDGKFDPGQTNLQAVQAEQRWINTRIVAGWTAVGLGVGSVGAGYWLRARALAPARVAALVGPTWVGLVARF